jgi:predicted alpha/beta superfamily hydrolase
MRSAFASLPPELGGHVDTSVHPMRSEHVGDDLTISVGRCSLTDEAPREVLLVVDASLLFGVAMGVAHGLLFTKRFPSLLVVGVGYPETGLLETQARRRRDFTPTAVEDRPGSGGGPAFLRFLRDELMPWLDQRYGVQPGSGTFFGHSLAGLFGSWVLLHEPSTFCRYGLSSPSLWWDNGSIFEVEAEYARTHTDLQADVFLAVGELESAAGKVSQVDLLPEEERSSERAKTASYRADMVAGARLLADALRNRDFPSLSIELQVQPGEGHMSVAPLNVSRALRCFWPAPV